PQHRRAFQQDEPRRSPSPSPLQRNGMFRPGGRSIYKQRQEYSETLTGPSDNFVVRVEHLFTTDLDGREMRTLDDCVAKLKHLDAKGRVWPQDMLMDVQGGYLLLSDIETKDELEALPLSAIVQTKAVLDSCAYNSLLTVSLRQRGRVQVYLFQCEETGVSPALPPGPAPQTNTFQTAALNIRVTKQESSPLSEIRLSVWNLNVSDSYFILIFFPQEILNHVLDDLEIFMNKVAAAAQENSGKKKKRRKKAMKNGDISSSEFVRTALKLPSRPGTLQILVLTAPPGSLQTVFQYDTRYPPNVVSPLLTDSAVELLEQVVTPDEDQLWKSLGNSWFIPRSRWPEGNVEPYVPQFYSGWQPPAPIYAPPPQQDSLPRRGNASPYEPPGEGQMMGRTPRQQDEHPDGRGGEGETINHTHSQVIQKSTRWWLVQNSRGQEGNVPQNVLEDARGGMTLDMNSTPADVKAWLRHKGFSSITVSSLGVLNGKLLLGMSKNEIKTVCPEEGGKVFFQLQAVKSSIALASEQSGMYNGGY
uniref:EPS8-like 3b n=1 Tax=Salarias fasciatus TaxID=181472 RepID=A0A672F5P1_SALFA